MQYIGRPETWIWPIHFPHTYILHVNRDNEYHSLTYATALCCISLFHPCRQPIFKDIMRWDNQLLKTHTIKLNFGRCQDTHKTGIKNGYVSRDSKWKNLCCTLILRIFPDFRMWLGIKMRYFLKIIITVHKYWKREAYNPIQLTFNPHLNNCVPRSTSF